jgi:hypothetical protein
LWPSQQVNSNTLEFPDVAWPYQVSGLASAPSLLNHVGSTLSQILPNNYSMPSLCSSSYPGASSMRGQPSSGSSAFYQVGPNRTDFYAGVPVDGLYDAYNPQSVPYALPLPEPQSSSTLYGNPENMRHWTSLGQSSRYNMSYDQELAGKFPSTNVPFADAVLSSASGLSDSSSMFPGLGGLANSLPVPSTLRSDRVLPNPRAGHILSSGDNLGTNVGVANETSSFIAQPVTKSNAHWGLERPALDQCQILTSRNSVDSSSAGSSSIANTEKKPSTSPRESQQTAFGYLEHSPITGSPTPTTDYEPSKKNAPGPSLQSSFLSCSSYDSGISSSTDSLLRRDFSSPSLYTYGSGSNCKDDTQSSMSSGTLLNGQPYTRLRQPQPQPLIMFDTSRRGSADTRGTHRTSIASVGGSHR